MALPLLLTAATLLPLAGRAIQLARARPLATTALAAGGALLGASAADIGPFGGGSRRRRRRRKALTSEDLRTMHEISTSISKKAAETFINQRVRRS